MTNPMNGPNGTWWKIAAIFIPMLFGAIIAFTQLRADVSNLKESVSVKADKDVVQANQEAILRELNSIEDQLRRIAK